MVTGLGNRGNVNQLSYEEWKAVMVWCGFHQLQRL